MSIERRRFSRFDVCLDVNYCLDEDNNFKTSFTKNIGPGGCLIFTEEKLKRDFKIKLQFVFNKDKPRSAAIQGKVVRFGKTAKGLRETGISFDGLNKDAVKDFTNFFFERMYKSTGLNDLREQI